MSNKSRKLCLAVALSLTALSERLRHSGPPGAGHFGARVPGKQDWRAAAIQLKNALDKDPSLSEARYLLGTALLQQRDSVGAELEFRKAVAAGFPDEACSPSLRGRCSRRAR